MLISYAQCRASEQDPLSGKPAAAKSLWMDAAPLKIRASDSACRKMVHPGASKG
jgi:hypothetical protein